jgi:hypothetical protein
MEKEGKGAPRDSGGSHFRGTLNGMRLFNVNCFVFCILWARTHWQSINRLVAIA